jgi:hypothetical protein
MQHEIAKGCPVLTEIYVLHEIAMTLLQQFDMLLQTTIFPLLSNPIPIDRKELLFYNENGDDDTVSDEIMHSKRARRPAGTFRTALPLRKPRESATLNSLPLTM